LTGNEESSYDGVDYKKMSATKLRHEAIKKGLINNDSSKIKKHDLLKLLGSE
jgi:hypothetical protein